MLTWMRRQSGKTWVKVMYVAIAVTFFGGFGVLSSSSRMQNCLGAEERASDVLMTVDGKPGVTEREWNSRYNSNRRSREAELEKKYPDLPIPESMIDQDKLRAEAMEQLIHERLLTLEAERLKLTVTDGEVQKEILRVYQSWTNNAGAFDQKTYHELLRQNGFTELTFEERLRKGLLQRKMIDLIATGIGVLPQELKERYAFEREKVKLDYAVVDPAKVAPEALPADTVVRAYFKKNPSEFFLGETRRVEYASWSAAEMTNLAKADESELKKYYEDGKARWQKAPEQVQARHILIKFDRKLESDEAKQKALDRIENIRQQALAGTDFAELAKKYSEDPSVKDNGGDLGWFIRELDQKRFSGHQVMVKEFEDAAFQLKPGQISEPVLTQYGFHLLKVTDYKDAEYLPLAEVRKDVEAEVVHAKALDLAKEKAQAVKAAIAGGKGFAEACAEADRKAVVSEFFQMTDSEIFRLADSKAIIDAAFGAKAKVNDVLDPAVALDHVYLCRLTEIAEAREGSFDEMKDRIVTKLKPKVELAAAAELAKTWLGKLKSGELKLADMAAQAQTEVQTMEPTERYRIELSGVSSSSTVGAEISRLSEDAPWPAAPLVAGGKVAILHLLATEPPDLSNFDRDKDFYERIVLSRKQDEALKRYFEQLKGDRVQPTKRWNEINGT
jgi:peptidyl-prolyl cis-trans isomerase D